MVATTALPPAVAALQGQAHCLHTPLAGSGGHIVWHRWGAPHATRPPVVLLHGGSGSWTHWLRTIGPLRDAGHEVWAVDLPGFGDSAAVPGGHDVDALIAPLQTSMAEALQGRVCDLVGFSFGGMAAGLLAAAYPALTRRLVLVGAPAMTPQPGHRLDLRGWRHLADPAAQLQVHRHNLQTLMLADPAAIDADTLALHAHNVARDRLPRRRLSHTDILARALAHVRCPVHAIYGARDALYLGRFTSLQTAFDTSGCDFRGLHLVENAGHWVQYEDPLGFEQQLAAAI